MAINYSQSVREVRNVLADISRLDDSDANRMVANRASEIASQLEEGRSPKDIATDIHLRSVIGLTEDEVAFIHRQPQSQKDHLIRTVSGYHPLILVGKDRNGAEVVYTGGAGDNWVSSDKDRAWTYSVQSLAEETADRFNGRTRLTGIVFSVERKYS